MISTIRRGRHPFTTQWLAGMEQSGKNTSLYPSVQQGVVHKSALKTIMEDFFFGGYVDGTQLPNYQNISVGDGISTGEKIK